MVKAETLSRLVTACLLLVGLINFVPLLAIVSAAQIESVYAIQLQGTDITLLMRHRALLFGILGSFTIYAAFVPRYQVAAMLMAGASMVGFALLLLSTGGYNTALAKVLAIDYVGIAVLLLAAVLRYRSTR